jgi:hypothetical protein
MSSDYFSDRERGPRPRTAEEITEPAWGGLVALVWTLVDSGALGIDFPDTCPDGYGASGTDSRALSLALQAEIPEISWPLNPEERPQTLAILDLLEFVHRHVSQPVEGSFHSFFNHSHLSFNREPGQHEFRERANRILARNGIAFDINADGRVVRLAPPVLREELVSAVFATGDAELDVLLESARQKFLSPDPSVRREALEKLWDAWERTKTLDDARDKKASVKALLAAASSEKTLRDALEAEAREVTRIGNTFRIRHSEASQIPIESSQQIDYLFHRLFALIQLLLRSRA